MRCVCRVLEDKAEPSPGQGCLRCIKGIFTYLILVCLTSTYEYNGYEKPKGLNEVHLAHRAPRSMEHQPLADRGPERAPLRTRPRDPSARKE